MRIYWYRIPLFASILPLGFTLAMLIEGKPLVRPYDWVFLWFSGMAILLFHLMLQMRKRLKKLEVQMNVR